jgi:hypothetical protein
LELNCRAPTGPPQQLDWGSNRSLCCEEEEKDLQGVECNGGKACVITAGFFMESLVKLPFVSAEPRAGPVINHVRVTNVARQANRRNPVLL